MTKILMIGHRQGLVEAVMEQGLDFLLWNDKELKNPLPAKHLVTLPWPRSPAAFRGLRAALIALGPFAAVIGGSERAIPLVAAVRRGLGMGALSALNLFRCHDKLLMKRRLEAAGIPLNRWLWGPSLSADVIWQQLGPRVVCKDRTESGGRSIQIYSKKSQLKRELQNRQRLFEAYNPNPEFSVESFIEGGRILFTNFTQYYLKQHINLLPAALPEFMAQTILDMNQKVIAVLGLQQGMTHMELYLGPEGPVFGEIAVRPPGGYIMELLELAYAFNPWQAYLQLELGRPCSLPQRAQKSGAVHVLHPGPGVIQAIKGWAAVKDHPAVHRAKLKVAVGDSVRLREAVGEDVGYVLQTAPSVDALIPAVEDVRRLLQWTMGETG